VHLLVLLDESASMPPGAVGAAWSAIVYRVASLPEGSRLSVIRIGARPVVELNRIDLSDLGQLAELDAAAPPRRLPLVSNGTNLDAALRKALALLAPQDDGLILLISDGAATLGNPRPWGSPEASAGVPLIWWDPTRGETIRDARIASLEPEVRRDGTLSARVRMATSEPLTARLAIRLDGRLLAERTLNLDGDAALDLDLGATPDSRQSLSAVIEVRRDQRPGNDRRGVIVGSQATPRVCLVARSPEGSTVAQGLASGGWDLRVSGPQGFDPMRISECRVLILEGIRPIDLDAGTWRAVQHEVTFGGQGLVVLGGPGTFGTGGYRHSPLEDLLPVTSEAPERIPAAAVLYALDKSGSMARPTALGPSRHELARLAVARSAGSLAATDHCGLLAFDVESRRLLALARHEYPAAAMRAAPMPPPGGGTALGPVIRDALELLADDPSPQRLLVLVSDGQVSDAEDAASLGSRLAAAGIEPVVLSVGEATQDDALRELASAARGSFSSVTALDALPELMQLEVERRRDPIHRGPVVPRVLEPLPIASMPAGPWPPLAAYPITKARAGAQVYLAAASGDPLLAGHGAGVGRVLVLPAGLSEWAQGWSSWAPWAKALGELIAWAGGAGEPLAARMEPSPEGGARVLVELATPDGRWSQAPSIALRVLDPLNQSQALEARAIAPGLYAAELGDTPSGPYRILADGGASSAQSIWYQPEAELEPVDPSAGTSAGLPGPWASGLEPTPGLPLPRCTGGLPTAWVIAALMLYLGLLLHERMSQRGAALAARVTWGRWRGLREGAGTRQRRGGPRSIRHLLSPARRPTDMAPGRDDTNHHNR
jgi:Mg-chelatase subunit ChlD